MKVSRAQAEANRQRVVEVAGRLLRENGLDGIGVDGLMQGAGLTHGGFYKSFGSKEALAAEACSKVMAGNAAHFERLTATAGKETLATFVNSYLSTRHRDNPGSGCAFAALGTDAGRRGGVVRSVFTKGLRTMVDQVASIVSRRGADRQREAALVTVASLVGALVLARAVDDPDLSRDLLAATRRALGGDAGEAD
jgi:TetR/AcrR family transcriptional repressor of nem operon